ncbi:UPF0716 protein FxsA [Rhodobacter viridis]|uniref:UPF0716 protein FxsA n=1 Tax=Rhodobacter viridis TaxID=1054202 RepID=A0A318U1E8_9RHOB|nr:FxsA family protein [Rhodobacter viridis]PYF11914.1 UPF0716 protein FxsA [Rhodobacter viridis]
MWFLMLLMAWPLIEIGLFVEIGGRLGLWPTLGLVLGTAALGIAVLRAQGDRAQAGLRQAMQGFGNPAVPLAQEALILVAGGLLILPGFFTDLAGLLLLLPPVRALLIARLSKRVVVQSFGTMSQTVRPEPEGGQVIDGDFQEIDAKNPALKGNSGWTRH